MGTRFPSHQLSNGLYVSGLPEQPKEKTATKSSVAVPYTGGDIEKSVELSKMFAIPPDCSKSRKSGPITGGPQRAGSFATHSGPLNPHTAARPNYSTSGPISSTGVLGPAYMKKSKSGPLSKHGEPIKKSSGPQSGVVTPVSCSNSGLLAPVLPTTGLITSGPISSGPLTQSGALRKASGPKDASRPMKLHSSSSGNNQAVTTLGQEKGHLFMKNLPRPILWAVVMLFMIGFMAGGFILGSVNNAILLIVVVVLFCLVAALFIWNLCVLRKAVIGYIASYPNSELRTAKNGQFVKVTGVVTCRNVPLKSSFQNFPRCVFTSTSLYEYRGWSRFTWALRFSEKHVVDFYISDFQSGLRALVKAGFGARVIPFVDENIAIDFDPSKKDSPPDIIRWLEERNLSLEDHPLRLKEGCIKEGSTVSVMGVVQRNENVLMIVPPTEPLTTGCQWANCTFPASFDGLVLRYDGTSEVDDAIPV